MAKLSTSGYSGTPLVQKLGVKAGDRVRTRNAPKEYRDLLAPLPGGVTISPYLRGPVRVWHVFSRSRRELQDILPLAMQQIAPDGMLWVSWPKKASGVASEITEDTVRELALPLGLVDTKVCAVDATWSALKLVIRKELR